MRNDKMDRLTMQSVDGKVVTITHDQSFPDGKKPLYVTIFDLAVANFGAKDDDSQAVNQGEVAWPIGMQGQTLERRGCGDAMGMNAKPEGEDDGNAGPTMSFTPPFFNDSAPGCKFLFAIDPVHDGSDPKLLSGLRTVLIDTEALQTLNMKRANADSDSKAAKEKAVAQATTGL